MGRCSGCRTTQKVPWLLLAYLHQNRRAATTNKRRTELVALAIRAIGLNTDPAGKRRRLPVPDGSDVKDSLEAFKPTPFGITADDTFSRANMSFYFDGSLTCSHPLRKALLSHSTVATTGGWVLVQVEAAHEREQGIALAGCAM